MRIRDIQKEFDAGILHHRKLISVIKEKITRPSRAVHPHLHFEPYEFFWQPTDTVEPVRLGVHGKLYTSNAFLETDRELQDSPGEPGCDLPRVVLGLMFSSDGTQLTSFSNAKLWPVYLVIGNESKDRRSKPSCHAFEHIAYLETVRSKASYFYPLASSICSDDSFRTPSKPLQLKTLVGKGPIPLSWHIAHAKCIMLNLNGR
jgi:hypothetical protein